MSSLHAQKTLVKTEPRAITKADSVSMRPSLAAAVPDAFSRGKSAREHGSGVYISDTTVAFLNGMRLFYRHRLGGDALPTVVSQHPGIGPAEASFELSAVF